VTTHRTGSCGFPATVPATNARVGPVNSSAQLKAAAPSQSLGAPVGHGPGEGLAVLPPAVAVEPLAQECNVLAPGASG
jgi:hypothetical protein